MPKRKNLATPGATNNSTTCVWTPAMDTVLIDAFLNQHNEGNRVGGSFTSQAYDSILSELKGRFSDKPLDKEKAKNRIKFIKNKFASCYNLFKNGMNGFAWNPITNMWNAEPEVWQRLIEAKPEAAEWLTKPIPHYDKLVQLYGQDKAAGENAETAYEIRQRMARSSEDDFIDTIDGIDHIMSQNEAILENLVESNEEKENAATTEARHRGGCQSATSSRKKKARKKCSKEDERFELMREALENVARAIIKSTTELMKSNQRLPIAESEIWEHLTNLGVEPPMLLSAYLYLVEKPHMLRALLGCPLEKRKELLLHMMFGFSNPPNN